MLMPERGPMPGKTPTNVPTTQPRKAYHSTSHWKATWKPRSRLSMVFMIADLELEEALLERRLQRHGEEEIGQDCNAGAVEGGAEYVLALGTDEEGEHHQRHRKNEPACFVAGDGNRRDHRDSKRVRKIFPIDIGKGDAVAGAYEQQETEADDKGAEQFRKQAGTRHRPRARRQIGAHGEDANPEHNAGGAGDMITAEHYGATPDLLASNTIVRHRGRKQERPDRTERAFIPRPCRSGARRLRCAWHRRPRIVRIPAGPCSRVPVRGWRAR